MIHTLILKGKPIPLARARYSRHKKVYDIQKNHKLVNGLHLKSQYEHDIITYPIILDVVFYMPIPQHLQKNVAQLLIKPHAIKPDTSNLLKMIEDILVDAQIIKDDSLICKVIATKLYSQEHSPSTHIKLVPYE